MVGKYDALRNLVPANVLTLGTLVVHPDDPLRSFFKPNGTAPAATITAQGAEDYNSSSVEGSGSLSLAEILSAGCGLKESTSVDLKMASSTLQSMVNYDAEFSKLCKTDNARAWFEHPLERYGAMKLRLYYVIGLQTVRDASLILTGLSHVEAKLSAQLPLAQLLGDPGVLANLVNPSAKADVQLVKSAGQKFSIAEAVYGVRYGVITFKYLSSRSIARMLGKMDLEQAQLEQGTRWVVTGTDAGGEVDTDSDDSEDDVEDMIEANLNVDE
ncbi:hypothetical protein IL306_014159 [Fusarium sp. DS 682]|nr:hypothetical protein IL306_014159 [Fusarium sp. DS 682]